ncbi:MAG: transglycosylase domain-containing protein, partial [Gammaproteobacteria bacterium]
MLACVVLCFAVGMILFVGLLLYLDVQVLARFSGDEKWRVPGKVYARALEMYSGALLSKEMLHAELELLRYERVSQKPSRPGTYRIRKDRIDLVTRGFQFWDGVEPQAEAEVVFRGAYVSALQNGRGEPQAIVRLEPALIGGFFPEHREDRLLIALSDTPQVLLDALMLVEDRRFYSHWGVSLRGMARAFLVNMQQGRVTQGGSTLTQQLVKNYFLHSERTVSRKIKEVLMAVLLELHFSKEELLEAYLNEVYLGQAGSRAIHGFGLASYHYFGRPLSSIDVEQWALLVALVKGPSYYDPRRHPERARARRNQVLAMMAEAGLLNSEELTRIASRPLGVLPGTRDAVNMYPAFMDLVRRQLQQTYPEDVLSSEGLMIFTTLDPQVQAVVEREVAQRVPVLARSSRGGSRGADDDLQAAVVVSAPESGEVLSVVGGTAVKMAGFNRALDAKRPVGSIIKPFVYMAALMEADYRLNTVISDGPFQLSQANGKVWKPKNFDEISHGDVLLQEALVNSYNQATARLAMDVGMEKVVRLLDVMGLERRVRPLPAVALGALDLSPFEVMQLYQTLAAGGFNTRLRAIRAVVRPNGAL